MRQRCGECNECLAYREIQRAACDDECFTARGSAFRSVRRGVLTGPVLFAEVLRTKALVVRISTPLWIPFVNIDRDHAGQFLLTREALDAVAVHIASDIPLSAFGHGASLFRGAMDNTEVFFRVMRDVLGGVR